MSQVWGADPIVFTVGTDITSSNYSATLGGATKDDITISSTTSAFYSPLRVYDGTNVVVSAAGGKLITGVSFTITQGGKFTVDGESTPMTSSTWTGSESSITFVNSTGAQIRISAISVTVAENTPYDITLYRNGASTTVHDCQGVYALPTSSTEAAACTGWDFKGWISASSYNSTDEPTFVTSATGEATYYAVYGKTVGGTGYVLTDAAPVNGEEVIVAAYSDGTYYAIPNTVNNSAGTALTVDGNNYITSSTTGITWQIVSGTSSGQVRMRVGSAGNYIHYNSSDFKAASGTTNADITFSSYGNGFKMTGNSRVMTFNGTTTNFGLSTTASNAAVAYIFKYNDSGVTTYKTSPECGPETYTVTYDKNGATGGVVPVDNNSPYDQNAEVTVLGNTGNLTNSPLLFRGWNTAANGSGTAYAANATFNINANTTLYAQWGTAQYRQYLTDCPAQEPKTTITVMANNNTAEQFGPVYVQNDDNTNLAYTPTYANYRLAGFYDATSGGKMVYDATGTMQMSVSPYTDENGWIYATDNALTLYARWIPLYNVTYDANTGSYESSCGTRQYASGDNVAICVNIPTKYESTFLGYATASDGEVVYSYDGENFSPASFTMEDAAVTLYAKWADRLYTVTLDAGNGTCAQASVQGSRANGVVLPDATPSDVCTSNGWEFYGWATTSCAETTDAPSLVSLTAGKYMLTADITLYAVYTMVEEDAPEVLFTETFDSCEGDGGNDDKWSGSIGISTVTCDQTGWTFSNEGGGDQCLKLGSSSKKGTATTKSITMTKNGKLTFRAGAYSSDGTGLTLSATGCTLSPTSVTMEKGAFKNFEVAISGITRSTAVTFTIAATNTSSNRFFLDDVEVSQFNSTTTYASNPTCAACETAPTFTASAPATSNLSCTGVTAAMTDGLATIGTGNCRLSAYGFVWGTSATPTLESNTGSQKVGTNIAIGSTFNYNITGLTAGTQYYIRAYATNGFGTAYSDAVSVTALDLSSISIETAPDRTKYVVGETFDKTGLVVNANYNNGESNAVTLSCTFSPATSAALTTENTVVTIQYVPSCGTTRTVDQAINVYTTQVSEDANPSYGETTISAATVTVNVTEEHAYMSAITADNAELTDNGDNTYTITNPTGNVTVHVEYAMAAQVAVNYYVGSTLIGSANPYQGETVTLPAKGASGLVTGDEDYPVFMGWSTTPFDATTAFPAMQNGRVIINEATNYYAVFSNVNVATVVPSQFTGSYDDKTLNYGESNEYVIKTSGVLGGLSATNLQFRKNASTYGRIYNTTSFGNILKIEIANADLGSTYPSNVPVYAGTSSTDGTGGTLVSPTGTDVFTYTFPTSTEYFCVRGDNSYVYKPANVTVYFIGAGTTAYYMTNFCTKHDITGATKTGTAVTGGTLTVSKESACPGTEITLTAAAATGYEFTQWNLSGATPASTTSTTTTFTMPDANVAVAATFSPILMTAMTLNITEAINWNDWKSDKAMPTQQLSVVSTTPAVVADNSVTWTVAPAGVVAVSPTGMVTPLAAGTAVVTATANDGSGVTASVTFNVSAKQWLVTVEKPTGATLYAKHDGQSESGAAKQYFVAGETVTIRAAEKQGYTFTSWNVTGATVADATAKTTTFTMPEAEVTIDANWDYKQDTYIDDMHSRNIPASDTRGAYTAPTLTEADSGFDDCEAEHTHFVGWIEGEIGTEDQDTEPAGLIKPGQAMKANGKTYHAVWAVEL